MIFFFGNETSGLSNIKKRFENAKVIFTNAKGVKKFKFK